MFKFRTILLCFLIIATVRSSCGVGTLSCVTENNNSVPKICDFFNFYSLNEAKDACVQNVIENCQIGKLPNQSKECFICDPGYILDFNTNKCAEVSNDNKIDNCHSYSTTSCIQCKPDYYISGTTCTEVGATKIDHCVIYSSATQCQMCEDGSYLLDNKCHVFKEIPNCHLHRKIECDKCDPKFVKDGSTTTSFDFNLLNSHSFDFTPYVKNNLHFEYLTEDFKTKPCGKGSIDNCLEYSEPTKCSKCEDGFYLNPTSQCVHQQKKPILGCKVYKNEDTCMECDTQYFLDTANNVCESVSTVEFCVQYHRSKNECIQCQTTHRLGSQDSKVVCELISNRVARISHCGSYEEDNTNGSTYNYNVCKKCNSEFVMSLDKSKCLPEIKHCKNHLVSSGEMTHHLCYGCEQGFSPSPNRSQCIPDSLSGCIEVRGNDSSKCVKCEPTKYRTADYKCVNLSNPENCYQAASTKDECAECEPLFWLTDGKCLSANSRASSVIDSHCESNSQSSKSSECDACKPGFMAIHGRMAAVSATFMTENNCAKIDPKTGDCIQCAENSVGDGTNCGTPNPSQSSPCIQMRENYMGSEITTNCAKCREDTQHVNPANFTCEDIPDSDSCAEFEAGTNNCVICETGYFPSGTTNKNNMCMATGSITNYSNIPGCAVYNSSNGKCLVCDSGRVLSSNQSSCAASNTSAPYFFDDDMILSNASNISFVSNCSNYQQVDSETVLCGKCKSGYVKIVDLNPVGGFKYVFDMFDGEGTGGLALPASECAVNTQYYKTKDNDVFDLTKCDTGIKEEGTIGFACVKCQVGYNANTECKLTKEFDETPLSSTIEGIGSCVRSTKLTQKYKGLGNHINMKPNTIPLSTYLNYTACDDDREQIVFNSIVDIDGSPQLIPNNLFRYNGITSCITGTASFLSELFYYLPNISNCQILSFSNLRQIDMSKPDLCLACKAGFTPVLHETLGIITDCVDQVDAGVCNSPGNVLNGCDDSKYGYMYDPSKDLKFSFSNLMKVSGGITNCNVFSYDHGTCYACQDGYSLKNNECIDISTMPAVYNCGTKGYGDNALSLMGSKNKNTTLQSFVSYMQFAYDFTSKLGSSCAVCSLGFVRVKMDESTSCVDISTIAANKKTDNCLKYSNTESGLCSMCESGYIMNKSTGDCVDEALFPHCKYATGKTSAVCGLCEEPFGLTGLGVCVRSNCSKTASNGDCYLCNDDYKLRSDSKQVCDVNSNSSDACIAYSPTLNSCGKCRNNKKLYIFNDMLMVSDKSKKFVCEDLSEELSTSGWSDYNLENTYILVTHLLEITLHVSFEAIITDEIKPRLLELSNPDSNPSMNHCWPERDLANCQPFDMIDGLACLTCDLGFNFDPVLLKCVNSGSVPNCAKYSDSRTCQYCEEGFYLNSLNRCEEHSSGLGCLHANPLADSCQGCRDPKTGNDPCLNPDNCKELDNNNDCMVCFDGYELDPRTKKCQVAKPENCSIFDQDTAECQECIAEFWLDAGNVPVCKPVTPIDNCTTYEKTKDECKYCDSEHFLEDNDCKPVTDAIQNCIRYIADGKCDMCVDGMLVIDNACVGGNIPNCKVFTSPETCEECETTHYLESPQVCKLYSPDLECQNFNKIKDECTSCHEGYELDSTNKCIDQDPDDPCKIKGQNGVCEECKTGFILNQDTEQCDPRRAENCEEVEPLKDQCKKCKPKHWMDADDENKCKPHDTVNKCVEYFDDRNECHFCDSTSYLEDNKCENVSNLVEHCQIYLNDNTCSTCDSTYTLNEADNICDRGNVENCKQHENNETCKTCNDGHFLENSQSCTPYSDDLHCKTFSTTQDKCVDCNENYFLNLSEKCELRDLTLNCLEFVERENKCLSCLEDFFYQSSDKTCQARQNKTCETYEVEKDECKTCEKLQYLNNDKECVDVNIVSGCDTYKLTEDACDTCVDEKFLDGGACEDVTTSVDDCKTYSSATECSECDPTFYLEDNDCKSGSLRNCQIYESRTECKTCDENTHYVNSSKTCSAYSDDLNCETFDPNADKCLTCNSGFHLSTLSKCIEPPKDPNCETLSGETCTECKEGFYLDDNDKLCKLNNAENCEVKSKTENKCESCLKKFWMNSDNQDKCEENTPVDFCVEYSQTEDECESCETIKKLVDGKCVTQPLIIEDCLHYDDNNVCDECEEYKMLSNNDCVDGETTDCLKYNIKECKECVSGHYLTDSKQCTDYSDDLNCATFDKEKDECLTCPTDYTLNGAKKCVADTVTNPGCKTPGNTVSTCTECEPEFIINNGKCDLRTAENCDSVKESVDECENCKSGFYMDQDDSNKCKELTTVFGCAVYHTYQNKCQFCDTDRYPKEDLCFVLTSPIDHCKFYSDNGKCETCLTGFVLSLNECGEGNVEKCDVYKTADTCDTCETGYYLQNPTTCSDYSSDLNCKTFNPEKNECINCNADDVLNGQKKCISDNSREKCLEFEDNNIDCKVCKNGFYLDLNTKKCNDRTAENCATVKPNADECETCIDNHFKDSNDNKCKPQNIIDCIEYVEGSGECSKCEKNHYLEDNDCKDVTDLIENCDYYSANGTCSECESGFGLVDNKCIDGNVDNCKLYQTGSIDICEECVANYFLDSPNKCTSYSEDLNCKEFVKDRNECASCMSNYFINASKKCELYDMTMNCLTFKTTENKCETCSETHFFETSTETCKERTALHCETTEVTSDECTTCVSRHYKVGINCEANSTVDNCAEYSETQDKCLKCDVDYVLISSKCEKVEESQQVEFCVTYSAPESCTECLKNYFLKNSSTCGLGLIPNCEEFASEHVCIKCRNGYYKKADDKCETYSADLNCDTFSTVNDECVTCPQNNTLNEQKKCVAITSDPNCEKFEKDSADCNTCKDNYVLNVVTKKCEERTAVNCKDQEPKLDKCETCTINHWMDANDFFKCKPVTAVSNCNEYKSDEDACMSCQGTNFLDDDECKPITITPVSDCAAYSSATECSMCTSENVLENATTCTPGSITDCLIYESASKCTTCKTDHFLESDNKCTEYSEDLNCLEKNTTKDECLTCADSRFLNTSKKCETRSNSTNCKTADLNKDECVSCNDDSFKNQNSNTCETFTATGCKTRSKTENTCITCIENYYFDSVSHKCEQHTPVDNCSVYYDDEDLCHFCNDNFFLDVKANICRPNPDGIEGCVEYSDKDVCSKCNVKMYLANNKCVNVPPASLVGNCLNYSNQTACSECETGYFLANSATCTQSSLNNCLELFSLTSCKKCSPGYVLKRDENNLVCEYSGITNCEVAIGGNTPTCMKCTGSMIPSLDRQSCQMPGTTVNIPAITNCMLYSEVNQCKQCQKNYIRSSSCNACNENTLSGRIDSNCESEIQLNNMVCDTCQPGYHKNFENDCVPCGGDGCAMCENETCQLCKEGYYMDGSQKCLLNSGTETEPKSVLILQYGILWSLILSILLWKD